jgi:hypothetical protein
MYFVSIKHLKGEGVVYFVSEIGKVVFDFRDGAVVSYLSARK